MKLSIAPRGFEPVPFTVIITHYSPFNKVAFSTYLVMMLYYVKSVGCDNFFVEFV